MAARSMRARLRVVALVALASCGKVPAEPDSTASSATPRTSPLLWDAPGSWTRLDVPPGRAERAAYTLDRLGGDKGPAEVHAFFFGTGAGGDPAKIFKDWLGQFDGDAGAGAARERFSTHGLEVETVEVEGTYKIDLTPQRRGHTTAPVQMVKKDYRLYGAVVKTPDRGNWFFKLTGPDEAVEAARSAFHTMLESAR
jgi:hypothetical protein